jgi:hypothetical protein
MACPVGGSAVIAKGTPMFGASQGGSAIAEFAGQPVEMRVESLPPDMAGRAHVRTTAGLRIDGWIETADLPLFLSKPATVVKDHIWIEEGQRAKFLSSGGGEVRVEFRLTGALRQTERIGVTCASLALSPPVPSDFQVPGNGLGYLPQSSSITAYPGPGAPAVFTLHPADPGSGPLFFSAEPTSGGFVHVKYKDGLIVDAWIAESELTQLKRGETMDRLAAPRSSPVGARLVPSGQTVIVRASQSVAVRLSSQEAAPPIGTLDSGTEVYVLSTVLGWSSVMPTALQLLPPTGRSFWVKASDLYGRPDAGRP